MDYDGILVTCIRDDVSTPGDASGRKNEAQTVSTEFVQSGRVAGTRTF